MHSFDGEEKKQDNLGQESEPNEGILAKLLAKIKQEKKSSKRKRTNDPDYEEAFLEACRIKFHELAENSSVFLRLANPPNVWLQRIVKQVEHDQKGNSCRIWFAKDPLVSCKQWFNIYNDVKNISLVPMVGTLAETTNALKTLIFTTKDEPLLFIYADMYQNEDLIGIQYYTPVASAKVTLPMVISSGEKNKVPENKQTKPVNKAQTSLTNKQSKSKTCSSPLNYYSDEEQ